MGALAPVCGRAGVVAGKPIAGAPDLEHDRRDQERADKHMEIEEWPNAQDRYALSGQQEQEHGCDGAGQAGVSFDSTGRRPRRMSPLRAAGRGRPFHTERLGGTTTGAFHLKDEPWHRYVRRESYGQMRRGRGMAAKTCHRRAYSFA